MCDVAGALDRDFGVDLVILSRWRRNVPGSLARSIEFHFDVAVLQARVLGYAPSQYCPQTYGCVALRQVLVFVGEYWGALVHLDVRVHPSGPVCDERPVIDRRRA